MKTIITLTVLLSFVFFTAADDVSIIIYPTDSTLELTVGSTSDLLCEVVTSEQVHTPFWVDKNDELVSNSERISVSSSDKSAQLEFSEFQEEDSGTYTCVVIATDSRSWSKSLDVYSVGGNANAADRQSLRQLERVRRQNADTTTVSTSTATGTGTSTVTATTQAATTPAGAASVYPQLLTALLTLGVALFSAKM